MAIGIGIGLPFRRNIATTPAVPSGLSASFTVDTISGDLTWTDNSGGKAQYEVYSSTNGEAYTLLTTTIAGATSYLDTLCKQNASVVYRIRAKYNSLYSDYVTATTVVTPLCLKTNQSTLNTVTITNLNISSGTVIINWGDGNTNNYTGTNSSITKSYSFTGQYNITFSGDINNIIRLTHVAQTNTYGNITNWILPTNATVLQIRGCSITGTSPNIPVLTGGLFYEFYENNISASNVTTFREGMTNFRLDGQKVVFSTTEVDKLFKKAADWYQVNAPTANCTYNLSGANMGIPTGGASNVDIVRLSGYYTAAGKSATILVRTS